MTRYCKTMTIAQLRYPLTKNKTHSILVLLPNVQWTEDITKMAISDTSQNITFHIHTKKNQNSQFTDWNSRKCIFMCWNFLGNIFISYWSNMLLSLKRKAVLSLFSKISIFMKKNLFFGPKSGDFHPKNTKLGIFRSKISKKLERK